jgi:bacillithiol biosynthesis cysteine-adding enzyme BshC
LKQVTARETEPSAGRITDLAFSKIPGQSALFLRYLDDPLSLREFYPNVHASPADAADYRDQVLDSYTVDRAAVCARLDAINRQVGSGPATFANLQKLAEADCVAVVTGQQAGLLTGPLYTIYKALSAVKLAAELNDRGIKAVPLFWAATEDHDFEEVSSVEIVDEAGGLQRLAWQPENGPEGISVGRVQLDGTIDSLTNDVIGLLGPSPFAADAAEQIRAAWRAGLSFGDAFGRTIASLLGKYGVIYVDPLDPGLKRLASPLYAAAVEHADEIAGRLAERGKALIEAGFHEQVAIEPGYFPLFWHEGQGRRLALRKASDGRYRVKAGNDAFTAAELGQIARENPERLSPGVMLRAVVQDYLFPTLCYFGGGAEVAYFAQNSEVYRTLGRPVTPIFHRQSFSVIEPRQNRSMQRLGIGLKDLFSGEEALRLAIAQTVSGKEAANTFAIVEERINTELNRLDQTVSQIDPTVAASLATRRHKIIYHIAATRKKALLAQLRSDEVADRRVRELFATLLPHGALQERSINVFYFLSKYGPPFLDWICDAIDLDNKKHRLIRI